METFIWAESYERAAKYAIRHHINQWTLLTSPNSLRNLIFFKIIRVGEYFKNKCMSKSDIGKILIIEKEMLRIHKNFMTGIYQNLI